MDVNINGQRRRFQPTDAIGKGGEADIFVVDNTTVAKIFKDKNHPDLNGFPTEQAAAERRILEHQTKLKAFPKGMPPHVIAPANLVTNSKGMVVGYTMPFINNGEVLLRFTERKFRENVAHETVNKVFLDLHSTVDGVHKAGAVIGDFNDLNVLVVGNDAFLIDADSMQFGNFHCHVFTAKFLDPLLCMSDMIMLDKNKLQTPDSDWYAYNVMLFQTLLFVGPYGGIFKPADKTKKVAPDKRPLHRITVFNPEVQYPKPANKPDILPDDLLHHFHLVFERDQRGIFPRRLLESLIWTTCKDCGTVHTKHICPTCGQKGVGKVVQTIRIRGTVTATTVFRTSGKILVAAMQGGKLHWLYHENGKFLRDRGIDILNGQPDNAMRFRINGDNTLIGMGHQMVTIRPGHPMDKKAVDGLGRLPAIDANGTRRFWIDNGVLYRDSRLGMDFPEKVGDVLQGQTHFWVGEKFGFGYYRAGDYYGAFVFDAHDGILNNTVAVPKIPGQIIDSTCVFSDDMAWFLVKTQYNGQAINRAIAILPTGQVVAEGEALDGDGSWLGTIRGKCVMKKFMMAATDDGLVRIEVVNGKPEVVKEFPDAESFVAEGDHLFPAPDGIFVVSHGQITKLQIGKPTT